jgi:hypothetical protein
MKNIIDDNANIDVVISSLRATEDEIKKLEYLLIKKIGAISTPPKASMERMDRKGTVYQVTFKVTEPKHFTLEVVQEILESLTLVGWNINGTFVPGQ